MLLARTSDETIELSEETDLRRSRRETETRVPDIRHNKFGGRDMTSQFAKYLLIQFAR